MQSKYDIDLPQSIVESFARFLVPLVRDYYKAGDSNEEAQETEQGTDD